MKENYSIYALVCPKTNKIRYIGVTRNKNINKRLHGHVVEFESELKYKWIKSLIENNLMPSIVVLDVFDNKGDALDQEKHLIIYYNYLGFNLFNKVHNGYKKVGAKKLIKKSSSFRFA